MSAKRVKEEVLEENVEEKTSTAEHEEALIFLVEHCTEEVESLRRRINYYQSQVLVSGFLFIYFCYLEICVSFEKVSSLNFFHFASLWREKKV